MNPIDYKVLTLELLTRLSGLSHTPIHQQMGQSVKGELFILNYLEHNGGSALSGTLGTALGVSSARVAATLNSLDRKGFTARAMDQTDRRKIIVSLTESGRRHVLSHRQRLHRDLEILLRELGEQDAQEYLRIVGRIVEISNRFQLGAARPPDQ